jgi:hypothetical protein
VENNVDNEEDNEQYFTGERSRIGPQPERVQGQEPSLNAYQRMRTHLRLGEKPSHFLPGAPLETLVQALSHSDPKVRADAVRALGEVEERELAAWGNSTRVQLVKKVFYDNEWEVRLAAVEALEHAQEQSALVFLTQALHHDECELVQSAAATVLGALGDLAPLYPLMTALRTSGWRVKVAVLQAIRNPGILIPLDEVKAALHDSDISVRMEAIQTLGVMQGQAAVDYLASVAHTDHEWLVRDAAVLALERLGAQELSSMLRANLEVFPEERETPPEESPAREQASNTLPVSESRVCLPNIPTGNAQRGIVVFPYPSDDEKVMQKDPLTSGGNRPKISISVCPNPRQRLRTSLGKMLLWLCTLASRAQKAFAMLGIRHGMKQFLSRYKKGLAALIITGSLLSFGCFLLGPSYTPSPTYASPPKPDATLSRSRPLTASITVHPGQTFGVILDAHNTGSTGWSAQDDYQLICPKTGLTECMGVEEVPLNDAKRLSTFHYSFQFPLQAPSKPGDYYLGWSMGNHEEIFGQMCVLEVHVVPYDLSPQR